MQGGGTMALYSGIPCADCGIPFHEKDDVVVCPVCGAPHHRECYMKTGKCKFASLHAPDFLWQPQPMVLSKNPALAKSHSQINAQQVPENIYNQHSPASLNKLTNALPVTQTEDISLEHGESNNITEEEYAAYIGPNSFYYIKQFTKPEKSLNFFSVNWAAFFLESLYFFYRKMYGIGSIVMIFVAFINIPGILLSLETLFLERPEVFGNSLGYSAQTLQLLDTLSNVGFVLYFICRIACGVYANRLFNAKAIQEITEIKNFYSDNSSKREVLTALHHRGKPSIFAVMLALSVQFAIVSALSSVFL
jgi:hypothetical protein